MWKFYSIICLLPYLKMCQPTTTEPPHTTAVQPNGTQPSKTTLEFTMTSWYTTQDKTFFFSSTRPPQFLRLGNQTVDVNKSFKVPQLNEPIIDKSVTVAPLSQPNHVNMSSVINSSNSSSVQTVINSSKIVTNASESMVSGQRVSSSIPRIWQGTKHEHEGRYGPQFEDVSAGENTSIVVQAGDTALFDCRVSLLRDKTVSWLKRQPGEPPRLLTVGAQTYTGDSRFTVQFRYPGNWRLQITSTNTTDEGLYECQLSTHPPRVISVNLQVRSMTVAIVDDSGEPLKEQYYEAGSTLSLKCRIRGGGYGGDGSVWWLHGIRELHRDAVRGGVAVRSTAISSGNGVDSTLRVNRLTPQDAGNYTCAVPHAAQYAYTVLVHVLNESLAELQQGSSNEGPRSFLILLVAAVLFAIVFGHEDPS